MPVEQKWSILENEKGQGSFEVLTQIGKGDIEVQKVVPIFANHDDYHRDHLSQGDIISTVRFGKRGSCLIRVNKDAVIVEKMTRHHPIMGWDTASIEIPPDEFYEKIEVKAELLNNRVVFEMKGQTPEDLSVESIVVFNP